MKTCRVCKSQKPTTEFSKDKKSRDGISLRCRACASEQYRQWYEANKQKVIAKAAAWQKSNPEKASEKKRRYIDRHPDRRKESQRRYYMRPEVKAAKSGNQYRLAYSKQRGSESRRTLADEYVRRVMAQHLSITGAQLPQALVDAHREVMKIKRYLNEKL